MTLAKEAKKGSGLLKLASCCSTNADISERLHHIASVSPSFRNIIKRNLVYRPGKSPATKYDQSLALEIHIRSHFNEDTFFDQTQISNINDSLREAQKVLEHRLTTTHQIASLEVSKGFFKAVQRVLSALSESREAFVDRSANSDLERLMIFADPHRQSLPSFPFTGKQSWFIKSTNCLKNARATPTIERSMKLCLTYSSMKRQQSSIAMLQYFLSFSL